MSNNNAYTITGSGKITAVINGQVYTIDPTHPKYQDIVPTLENITTNPETFLDLVDLSRKVKDYVYSTNIEVKDGAILYQGEVIHNALTKKIIKFIQNDLPVKPIINFFENLMNNPSHRAVNELCDFIDAGDLPLTSDGHFLAYKNVKSDYKDIHSGTFDNSVGAICEMPRWKVDEDKDRTCSTGLHFCSIAYLPHFRDSDGGKTMILKINPADVVSIPADYNNTKGRTCKYQVIGEYTEDWRSKLDRGENGWEYDLYDEDGNEYDDDEGENNDDSYDCDPDNTCSCGGDDADSGDCCQVGNQGNDHLDGGCSEKPVNFFHNVRDRLGRFIPKNNQD
jgi:hypothetical protein